MFAGPIFVREALTAPRQVKHYWMRAGYLAGLFVLMYTATQATFGWQQVRNPGDIARFGSLLFQIFSLIQLALVLFFGVLFSASHISAEKDRRTLLLLLMTDLRDRELVLGKLSASLLIVGVMLAASLPAFAGIYLLGGVSLDQIFWSLGLCVTAGITAGSWGSLVAFWREKTFQTLAISVLGIVLFLGLIEAIVVVTGSTSTVAAWIGGLNPFRTLFAVLNPLAGTETAPMFAGIALRSCLMLMGLSFALITATVLQLRVWNPSRSVGEAAAKLDQENAVAVPRVHRAIWPNPVLWREMMTFAYGRKIIFIKLAYLVLAAFATNQLWSAPDDGRLVMGMISTGGFAFVGLSLVSLLLINAQGVTALTNERDAATLELLLVSDLSAKEFTFGKLGGILYNSKELILIPWGLLLFFVIRGELSVENFLYVTIAFAVLCTFAAMLGLHSGLQYSISRTAIANSLGTMFFLFVGIFILLMLIVQARSSFAVQLPCFLVFILGGSLGLWLSLTHRNPSPALALAAGTLPFCTFYAITSFLLGQTLGVCLFISAAYGFTTLAMLVPAITSFDVAFGRTLDRVAS